MCKLKAEVARKNPDLVLYNLVFSYSGNKWFKADDLARDLSERCDSAMSAASVKYMLDMWSSDGQLDKSCGLYRVC